MNGTESDTLWNFLPDPVAGLNTTPVYLHLRTPDGSVATVADALRKLRELPQPIAARLVSVPGNTVQLELCPKPKIIAGRSPHRLGREEAELREILSVLTAQGLEVTAPT